MRIPFLALLLCAGSLAQAQSFRIAAGVFSLVPKGADVLLAYRPGTGPWMFGIRHVQWEDTFHDWFTGRALSKTLEQRTGPVAFYLFRPQARGSWYLEGAVFRYAKRERSLAIDDTSEATKVAPAFGGGYMRSFSTYGFWHLGMVLSPGVTLETRTSTGSEEDHGLFDIQAQVGLRF